MRAMRRLLMERQNKVPTPGILLPLTKDLLPTRAVGSATFTRATIAYQQDFEKLNAVLSGEPRFQGARRVENLLSDSQPGNWFTAASVTPTTGIADPIGGTDALRLTATGPGGYHLDEIVAKAGASIRNSVWIRRNAGTGTVSLYDGSDTYGATDITAVLTTSWQRIATPVKSVVAGGSNALGVLIATSGDAVDIFQGQMEYVHGQAIQVPSEFVSKGVLSAPYHGAGVDGVQYFDTANGNTVASGIITEGSGAKLSGCLGYLSEYACTNLLTYSNDLTNAVWAKTTLTTAKTSTGPDGIVNSATRCTAAAGNATAFQTITAAATSRTFSLWVKRITGTGAFSLTQDGGATYTSQTLAAGWNIVQLNASQLNAQVGFKITTNADAFDIWGAQFEDGPFATSSIPSVATNAVRNTEILTLPTVNNIGATGTIAVDFVHTATNDPVAYQRIISSYPGATIPFGLDGVNHKLALYDGIVWVDDGSPLLPSNSVQKAAIAWRNSAAGFSLNGSAVSNITYTGPLTFGSTIAIGNDVNGAVGALNGPVRNVRIWQKQLSNLLLTHLTQ